ncbi:MAG: NAD(P)/FAD-dependent oxidoreductase [Gemmatimonadales bacterium]|nr:NAD(P)/FAD-dependent oxidoreductase [Gemmatimonadales bacterium]
MSGERVADVAVIGAGLAGTCVATILARRGHAVTLVEPREHYPDCFKAEKLEADQVALLRKHGLLDAMLPRAAHIRDIHVAWGGATHDVVRQEQYGIAYHDMVNQARMTFPAGLDWRRTTANALTVSDDVQAVGCKDGSTVRARLVVVASGMAMGRLHEQLGVRKRMVSDHHSYHFGFTVEREDGGPWGFDALTYHARDTRRAVDYLTLFRMGTVMRANLFTYWAPDDPRIAEFVAAPGPLLERHLPGLARVLGALRVVGKVERFPIDLYVADGVPGDGWVLVGDAYQSVCPATGTGLSKVLNDVDALVDHVEAWLATPGMGRAKTAAYYDDARKTGTDAGSLGAALYRRRQATLDTLRWRLHRTKLYGQMRLAGLLRRVRGADVAVAS